MAAHQQLFNFRFTPLDKIKLWGDENDHHLSWFGLTDGCYWLHTGDSELFRATQHFSNQLGDQSACQVYVDYFVARFWEDILEILPAVLTPVPAPLHEKLTAANLKNWRERVFCWLDEQKDIKLQAEYDATEWLRVRHLRTGYLKHNPSIWFWCDEKHVYLEWDNRDCVEQGLPVWEAELGTYVLSVDQFLAEVHNFHNTFMNAMQTRVERILSGWENTEIAIDKDYLVQEMADRQLWLEIALNKAAQAKLYDWTGVLEVAATIEANGK